jgi:hypothetical protein
MEFIFYNHAAWLIMVQHVDLNLGFRKRNNQSPEAIPFATLSKLRYAIGEASWMIGAQE